ncbi:MAG: hypothetical protein AB7V13_01005 [Pseudorhodoplanes sp.]
MSGQIRAAQVLGRGQLDMLSDAGFAVFAQTDEDGIISWLVDKLKLRNESFVEFGVHDYRESNTRYLLMTRNWKGLVIDGDLENIAAIHADGLSVMYDLEATAQFVTRDNIQSLIDASGLRGRLGLLSVDIDGVDYWVLERITSEADIIVVEYNDFLGNQPVTVPYTADFMRFATSPHGSYWGASLAAFRYLLEQRGYLFVGTNLAGVNAFFVHSDHAEAVLPHLMAIVHHPCKMREARDAEGRLAYRPYSHYIKQIAHLPVVRVDTSEVVALGQVCRCG